MEQAERRIYLIKALLAERPERYEGMTIPQEPSRQRRLLRALLNVRPPEPVSTPTTVPLNSPFLAIIFPSVVNCTLPFAVK